MYFGYDLIIKLKVNYETLELTGYVKLSFGYFVDPVCEYDHVWKYMKRTMVHIK